MPWITGADLEFAKACLTQCGGHVEAEIVLDVGLGALEQRCDRSRETLKHRRRGVLIHHHESTAWSQQACCLKKHGLGGILWQLANPLSGSRKRSRRSSVVLCKLC